MCADPEPNYALIIFQTKGPIAGTDPDGPKLFLSPNFLEVQRRMSGIVLE